MDPFHDALVRSPDDDELWSAYADWHEERGDPRAALMRAFSEAVVTRQWSAWFPGIAPAAIDLTWAHGFVRSAQVLDDSVSVEALLALPSMKWVRTLVFSRPATLGDLVSLPLLEAVTISDAARLSGAEFTKLAQVRRLHVPLSVLRHVKSAEECVHIGHDVIDGVSVSVSRKPQHAPADVLSMSRWTEKRERGAQSEDPVVTHFGPGRAVKRHARLTRCARCNAPRVVEVFEQSWTSYSHFETTVYETRELHCLSCRHFTAYRSMHER